MNKKPKKRGVKMETVEKESRVLAFLTKLATEPDTLTAFLSDPGAVMKKEGFDETAQSALTSGDPLQIHRSISPEAAAAAETNERSMRKAKEVATILSSDPVVAEWLQNHYYQALMTWLASARSAV